LQRDCGCGNCLCEGAVVVHPVEVAETVPAGSWILRHRIESFVPNCSSRLYACNSFGSSGRLLTGRAARIAIHSWQI
jgi:hypothetical protein